RDEPVEVVRRGQGRLVVGGEFAGEVLVVLLDDEQEELLDEGGQGEGDHLPGHRPGVGRQRVRGSGCFHPNNLRPGRAAPYSGPRQAKRAPQPRRIQRAISSGRLCTRKCAKMTSTYWFTVWGRMPRRAAICLSPSPASRHFSTCRTRGERSVGDGSTNRA